MFLVVFAGRVPINDMQTSPHNCSPIGFLVHTDAHCAMFWKLWTKISDFYYLRKGRFCTQNTALSQVRICRPPPPPSVLLPFSWKMRSAESNKNQFCDLYFLRYGWLYLQFTKTLPTKKKIVHEWLNFYWSDNDILVPEFFFVRLLVFSRFCLWSNLMYPTHFDRWHTLCMQNRPYTKSTISQKLKIDFFYFIGFRTLLIFLVQNINLSTFEGGFRLKCM